MLKRIELSNFRAFKNESFDLSSLNIFVGPNNSGKSSVISSLNLLAQTIDNPSFNDSPLVINGQYDQLGTFKDMVHGGRASTPIKISYDIEDYRYEFEVKYRLQRREMELSRLKLHRGARSIYEFNSGRDRYDVSILGKSMEDLHPLLRKSKPRFSGFLPRLPASLREIRFRAEISKDFDGDFIEFLRSVDTDLSRFRNRSNQIFGNFDSLGAFREMPQRTYLWSGETAQSIGRFGQNTVTLLARDSLKRGSEQRGYVSAVSEWLQSTGIAKGIKVKHLTERHFELVVVGNDGLDHNIADVGFGCSQVLPVLISGLKSIAPSLAHRSTAYSRSSTLVVQEPEIHLHPNAQAELGSFFVNLAMQGPQVFIETHSDNLVLRVARHVASGDIEPDAVKIFYIHDINGIKNVSKLTIDAFGTFLPDWPGGFFPQRQQESFALAKAAMKSRKEG